jgi:hypothetical protein
MVTTAQIDSPELAKLPTALRAIAGATGVAANKVVEGFAGVVLKACAGETAVASVPNTQVRSQYRLMADLGLTGGKHATALDIVTINSGAKAAFGRVFLRTSTGSWRRTHEANFRPVAGIPSKGRKKLGDHYSDYEWLVIRSAIGAVRSGLAGAREAGRRTRALGRQAWVQIGDTLGIRLEDVRGGGRISSSAISQARGAVSYRGRAYQNGLSRREESQQGIMLTLINRYPAGRRIGMDRTLRSVLLGQSAFFEKNLALGVFNSIEQTVRAYPFLKASFSSS